MQHRNANESESIMSAAISKMAKAKKNIEKYGNERRRREENNKHESIEMAKRVNENISMASKIIM